MLKWFQTSQTLAIGGQNTLAVKTWGFDRFDLVRSILAMRIAIGDAHRHRRCASPVRAAKSARTGAIKQAELARVRKPRVTEVALEDSTAGRTGQTICMI